MKKVGGVFLITLLIMAQACSLGNNTTQQPVTPISIISIYNGLPDAGSDVNMFFNSVQVNTTPIAYKTYIPYFKVDPGSRSIKFTNASSGVALIDTTFTLNEFKAYSIFLAKKLNSTKVVAIYTTDEGTLLTTTDTMVRFVNLSPDSQSVDVIVVGETTPLATAVAYAQASAYKEYSPIEYNVELRRSSDHLLLGTASLTSSGSGYYQTIILSGYLSDPASGANTLAVKLTHD